MSEDLKTGTEWARKMQLEMERSTKPPHDTQKLSHQMGSVYELNCHGRKLLYDPETHEDIESSIQGKGYRLGGMKEEDVQLLGKEFVFNRLMAGLYKMWYEQLGIGKD